jgi:hypothetical protein
VFNCELLILINYEVCWFFLIMLQRWIVNCVSELWSWVMNCDIRKWIVKLCCVRLGCELWCWKVNCEVGLWIVMLENELESCVVLGWVMNYNVGKWIVKLCWAGLVFISRELERLEKPLWLYVLGKSHVLQATHISLTRLARHQSMLFS